MRDKPRWTSTNESGENWPTPVFKPTSTADIRAVRPVKLPSTLIEKTVSRRIIFASKFTHTDICHHYCFCIRRSLRSRGRLVPQGRFAPQVTLLPRLLRSRGRPAPEAAPLPRALRSLFFFFHPVTRGRLSPAFRSGLPEILVRVLVK